MHCMYTMMDCQIVTKMLCRQVYWTKNRNKHDWHKSAILALELVFIELKSSELYGIQGNELENEVSMTLMRP